MLVAHGSADEFGGMSEAADPATCSPAMSDLFAGFDGPDTAGPREPGRPDVALAVSQAHNMLRFIEVSRQLFPGMRDLADHPGWEILLNVFIADRAGRTVTTIDLCDLTGCWRPLTVRYVELLFERGLIDRDISPGNPHAGAIHLTPEAEERFLDLLCGFALGWPGRYTGRPGE